jgi:hypothetical protein
MQGGEHGWDPARIRGCCKGPNQAGSGGTDHAIIDGVIPSLRPVVALAGALAVLGCNPVLAPRTGEVTPPRRMRIDVSVQSLTLEPQHVVEASGKPYRSVVGFFPETKADIHFGLRRCEVGFTFSPPANLAEVRCGLVQERRGGPVSIAFSGAFGVGYVEDGGRAYPAARVGVDLSHRFGEIAPLLDVYLSTAGQRHFIQTGTAWGPFPVGDDLARQEVRLSIPAGVAFLSATEKPHPMFDPRLHSATLGVVPWGVVWGGRGTGEVAVRSYQADVGLSLMIGAGWQ